MTGGTSSYLGHVDTREKEEEVNRGGWTGGWGGWASTFKQIGSLLVGSRIDGDRMICLTKYVTVRVSKREPNLYDGFWLARVSAVCRVRLSAVNVCVRALCQVRVLAHAHTHREMGAPMLSRCCINCKIEISASTIITIVNAPTPLLVRYRPATKVVLIGSPPPDARYLAAGSSR